MLTICGRPTLTWAVAIETVPVGNTANAADTEVMNDFTTGYGSVNYAYRIGKYEVTNSQYAKFLNAKATPGDPLDLYNVGMSANALGGIDRSGSGTGIDPFVYTVKSGRGNQPVVFVGWYDAIRFANWLHNGQGAISDTESGAYTILGGGPIPSNGSSITRNPGATWFLPNEDEWYKAAYNDPEKSGGPDYWDFPTRTDADPDSDEPPGDDAPTVANTGNYYNDDGMANAYNDGHATTGSPITTFTDNYLTDVGAYTQALSYYGTFDQFGNVREWTETLYFSDNRTVRGGAWQDVLPLGMGARHRISTPPTGGDSILGFRVATIVPEPTSLALLLLGWVTVLLTRIR